MMRRVPSPASGSLAALAAVAALALAPAAQAAVITYPSTDVPKQVDDAQMMTSTLVIPSGLPAPIDINVVGVRVSATGMGHNSKYLFLQGPNGAVSDLLPGGCSMLGFNLTYDDAASVPFSTPADCTATGTRRPVSPLAPLYYDNVDDVTKASGTWKMTFGAPPGAATPASLSGWGLEVSFEPMLFSVTAKKQELKKKLKIKARCTADCDVRVGGDAKGRSFALFRGETKTLKMPLKGNARNRLEGGGKAKIKLEASSDIGDLIARKAKVKVTD
jgi:opacity protein-like surface antigen